MLEWFTFFMIMAVGQFSPGPDMILLTRVSLAHGRNAGWATAAGIACGLMLHAGIAVSGLVFLLEKNTNVYNWVKTMACGYLSWLAYTLIKSAIIGIKFKLNTNYAKTKNRSLWDFWKTGFMCNLLNPKAAIFLASVTLPFLSDPVSENLQISDTIWATILWGTIFLEGLLLWALWVWLLQLKFIKKSYEQFAYLVDGMFGLCLIALVVILAMT